jgi:hypothetical protein
MPRISTSQPGYAPASCQHLEVGGGSHATVGGIGTFTMDSGSLLITGHLYSGVTSGSNRWGAIYMNGGTVNVGSDFVVGMGAGTLDVHGWLYMIGGTINDTGTFTISGTANTVGEAYISGGTINAGNFAMRPIAGSGTAKLDVSGSGKIVITGDKVALIEGYIDNGWLYSGGVQQTDYSMVSLVGGNTVIAPEPATLCLLGLGALSLIRRKK